MLAVNWRSSNDELNRKLFAATKTKRMPVVRRKRSADARRWRMPALAKRGRIPRVRRELCRSSCWNAGLDHC